MLTGTLRSLFAVVENYPELKANQNVLALQEQLTTTENQISFSPPALQRDASSTTTPTIATFPNVLIAGHRSASRSASSSTPSRRPRTSRTSTSALS